MSDSLYYLGAPKILAKLVRKFLLKSSPATSSSMTQTANPRLLVLCIVSSPIKLVPDTIKASNDRSTAMSRNFPAAKKGCHEHPSITNVCTIVYAFASRAWKSSEKLKALSMAAQAWRSGCRPFALLKASSCRIVRAWQHCLPLLNPFHQHRKALGLHLTRRTLAARLGRQKIPGVRTSFVDVESPSRTDMNDTAAEHGNRLHAWRWVPAAYRSCRRADKPTDGEPA